MRRRLFVRMLVVLAASTVAVGVVYLTVDHRDPDYEAIQGCTQPTAAPEPIVTEVEEPTGGFRLVAVADIKQATVAIPWRDDQRVLIANRTGEVWLLDPAGDAQELILDLGDRIRLNAEGGIIGAAIAPDGRHLYLHHTDLEGTSRILELETTTDGVDLGSEREVLSLPHPAAVHNGGAMAIDDEGLLYLGFGDGGGRPTDAERVASMEHLDGKLLRIDPRSDGGDPYRVPSDNPFVGDEAARPEIWLTGLRNPYRFSFDPVTGDLWVGDVGESCFEEITVLDDGGAGTDLGFPRFEGTHEFLGGEVDGATFPAFTYTHDDGGCAVIAGEVVRDPTLRSLAGRFLFSDFCAGGLQWLERDGTGVVHGTLDLDVEGVQSFGVGPQREVYLLTTRAVLRLGPAR